MPELTLREVVSHPASIATAVTGFLGGVMHLPLVAGIWAAVWGSLSSLFTAVSIAGFTLAPRVSWLPEEPLTVLALVLGGLFVVKLLAKSYDKFQTEL